VAAQASKEPREEIRAVGKHQGIVERQVHWRPAMAGAVEREERRRLGTRVRGVDGLKYGACSPVMTE
jgi:hypothetical protein